MCIPDNSIEEPLGAFSVLSPYTIKTVTSKNGGRTMIGAVKMELAVIAGKRNHVIVIGDDAAYDALPIKIQTAATTSRPLLFWTTSMLST